MCITTKPEMNYDTCEQEGPAIHAGRGTSKRCKVSMERLRSMNLCDNLQRNAIVSSSQNQNTDLCDRTNEATAKVRHEKAQTTIFSIASRQTTRGGATGRQRMRRRPRPSLRISACGPACRSPRWQGMLSGPHCNDMLTRSNSRSLHDQGRCSDNFGKLVAL